MTQIITSIVITDIITNSSSVVYSYADNVSGLYRLLNGALSAVTNLTVTAEELFDIYVIPSSFDAVLERIDDGYFDDAEWFAQLPVSEQEMNAAYEAKNAAYEAWSKAGRPDEGHEKKAWKQSRDEKDELTKKNIDFLKGLCKQGIDLIEGIENYNGFSPETSYVVETKAGAPTELGNLAACLFSHEASYNG